MSVEIRIGDCRERMAEMEPNSVDSCVTDPPYHLTSIVKRFGVENAAPAKVGATGAYSRASKGFMGQTWDGGDVAFDPDTWREVYRVLKPGAHLVAFSGTRTYHRMACAIEDAGFEIRDSIMWHYGSGFPKSHDVSKGIDKLNGDERPVTGTEKVRDIRNGHGRGLGDGLNASARDGPVYMQREITSAASAASAAWEGWGTALKPATEIICLARKPLSESSIARNVLAHGTGALNIDGCRIESEGGSVREGEASQERRYADRGSTNFAPLPGPRGGDPLGRWPANIVHDGSGEVLAAFPDAPGQQQPSRDDQRKQGAVYGAITRNGGRVHEPRGDTGSAARFFYCAKATTEERGEGNNHPTVKPIALMQWLCRLVTPPGGTVLDPFMGSGSTLIAADAEQFKAIGCELSADYAAIAEKRIRDAAGMFAEVKVA